MWHLSLSCSKWLSHLRLHDGHVLWGKWSVCRTLQVPGQMREVVNPSFTSEQCTEDDLEAVDCWELWHTNLPCLDVLVWMWALTFQSMRFLLCSIGQSFLYTCLPGWHILLSSLLFGLSCSFPSGLPPTPLLWELTLTATLMKHL